MERLRVYPDRYDTDLDDSIRHNLRRAAELGVFDETQNHTIPWWERHPDRDPTPLEDAYHRLGLAQGLAMARSLLVRQQPDWVWTRDDEVVNDQSELVWDDLEPTEEQFECAESAMVDTGAASYMWGNPEDLR